VGNFMDGFFRSVVFPFLAILGVVLIVMCTAALFCGCSPHKTVTLDLRGWSCQKYYEYGTTTYIITGKVLVPVYQYHKDCTQYNRN